MGEICRPAGRGRLCAGQREAQRIPVLPYCDLCSCASLRALVDMRMNHPPAHLQLRCREHRKHANKLTNGHLLFLADNCDALFLRLHSLRLEPNNKRQWTPKIPTDPNTQVWRAYGNTLRSDTSSRANWRFRLIPPRANYGKSTQNDARTQNTCKRATTQRLTCYEE